ncbi:MAG: isochorismatase family protein [Rhodobacteraceae bacterium]|nr:isochorismatase family protein [Paracoccaceae bacterium]
MATALVVIDMQEGMADRIRAGREVAVPDAPRRMAELLWLFRERDLPVVHVLHDDPDPASPFRRGEPGGAPMAETAPAPGETVFWKSGSSAFAGTGLDAHLRRIGADRIVLVGAVAAFCITSSTRAASDLGFRVVLPADAVLGFDIPSLDGGRIGAATVLEVTLAVLGADFATVMPAERVASVLG